jgi:hypothetical protein
VTPEQVLAGIRDGNYHRGGFRCLRLLRVEEDFFSALRGEVIRLCDDQSPSDARATDHVTNWTRPRGEVLQFSLLNSSGRCDDFSEDHSLSCFGKRFHLAARYPTVARLVQALPHVINLRVNVLGPRARLAAHEEHSIVRTDSGAITVRARFHLPIETNAAAELILDGHAYHLEAGTVYFVNHGCVHAASNGLLRRIHLVWDVLLTRQAYRALFEEGPAWSAPIADAERVPPPLRVERMGAFIGLPAEVGRDQAEAAGVVFCEPQ